MHYRRLALVSCALLAACTSQSSRTFVAPSAAPAFGRTVAASATIAPSDYGSLAYREVGPAVMGGRLDAVAGVPGDENTIYLGHSSGGLYKSTDGGTTFTSIFDTGTSSSIGALALAPSDPKTVYVGTGEGFPRNTAALGDGVFVSRDAGKTWKSIGLRATQHIGRIAVDPRDSRTVLVAAMGPEFSPGGMRGIYRTTNGGKTWTRTLYVNPTTGASDVTIDPSNPSVVYAGTFDYMRHPWTFRGGGVGSGLWRSSDGGVTWTRLTDPARHDGLPGGIINRVGVAICSGDPSVVYAIVPTKTGLLYRSDDGGASWRSINTKRDLVFRPFYFSQIRVNPKDPNDVWIISGELERSKDGGKTFKGVYAGGDNHDLWIDPRNPDRVLLGSDMGFDVSTDNGESWNYVNTIPMGQVYRVGFDRDVPYHVMGGFQDHEVWWGPNEVWNGVGVTGGDWRNISDWGDGQYAQPDPRDSTLIYEDTHFGDLTLRNLRTGEARYIGPQPIITFGTGAGSYPYRFNWSAPLLVSQVHPGTVYFGGNVLFRTTDAGSSWTKISPDLSQPCDRAYLLPSGGPITHDNTNAETYCTIYALAEGPSSLWAGTDNGNLFVTHDGGASWRDLSGAFPANQAPRGAVASIEVSRADENRVYVTYDAHRLGDTKPYIYVTRDGGATFAKLPSAPPTWAYVLREDPRQPNLLFAGTESGVYVSYDAGTHWSHLKLGLPDVPVYDMKIQPDANDLIVGTHGRGFVILDDLAPLEGLAKAVTTNVSLFAPPVAWRYAARPPHDIGRGEFVSDDKPYGATISYYLRPRLHHSKKAPKEKVTIEILQGSRVIKHIEGSALGGVNRVTWDLSTDPPGGLAAKQDSRPYYVFYSLRVDGPEVLPGTYRVRLKARGQTLEVPIAVRMDPAVHASASDLRAQYDAIEQTAKAQERAEVWMASITGDAKRLAHRDPKLVKQLLEQEDRLRNGNGSENAGYQFPARPVDQLAYLRHIMATSFTGATEAQQRAIDRYSNEVDAIGKDVEPLLRRAARELPARTPAPRRNPR